MCMSQQNYWEYTMLLYKGQNQTSACLNWHSWCESKHAKILIFGWIECTLHVVGLGLAQSSLCSSCPTQSLLISNHQSQGFQSFLQKQNSILHLYFKAMYSYKHGDNIRVWICRCKSLLYGLTLFLPKFIEGITLAET